MKRAVKVGLVATIVIGTIAVLLAFGFVEYTTPLIDAKDFVQLNSWTIHSGLRPASPTCTMGDSAYMTVVLNNHGTATNITQIIISTENSANITGTAYYLNGVTCTQMSPAHVPRVDGGGAITSITLYLGAGPSALSSSPIQANQSLACEIYFAIGQVQARTLLSQ